MNLKRMNAQFRAEHLEDGTRIGMYADKQTMREVLDFKSKRDKKDFVSVLLEHEPEICPETRSFVPSSARMVVNKKRKAACLTWHDSNNAFKVNKHWIDSSGFRYL